MTHEIDWTKSHNGIMLCTFNEAIKLMPEVEPILQELRDSGKLELPEEEYRVDVKIHMLMPNTWPCIPNWHRDFMPRDKDGNRIPEAASEKSMFMWLSGAPLTEYMIEGKKGIFKAAQQWHTFKQDDLHRGTMSEDHQWRCFIRVIPAEFVHSNTLNVGKKRQHIQTYLDVNKFI